MSPRPGGSPVSRRLRSAAGLWFIGDPVTPYPDIPVAERDVMLILGRSELYNAPPMAVPASPDLADIQTHIRVFQREIASSPRRSMSKT